MKFETITAADLDKLRNLQPEDWADIIPDIAYYIKSSICNPMKAIVNDTVAGIGTSIVFENTAWIAHIIVNREFRNKGIGSTIVNNLLESLRKDSIVTCSLIATELGKPVYLKAGFKIVCEYTFLQREKPWTDYPVSENIISFKEEYRNMIYELDKQISGENREKLLNDLLANSLLSVEKNKVLGYYLPNLKEGLIFADTEEAGLELMKLKYSNVDKAVLPSDNAVGIKFLTQNGFVETKKASRMIYGKNIDWKPEKVFGRIGGNLG